MDDEYDSDEGDWLRDNLQREYNALASEGLLPNADPYGDLASSIADQLRSIAESLRIVTEDRDRLLAAAKAVLRDKDGYWAEPEWAKLIAAVQASE